MFGCQRPSAVRVRNRERTNASTLPLDVRLVPSLETAIDQWLSYDVPTAVGGACLLARTLRQSRLALFNATH